MIIVQSFKDIVEAYGPHNTIIDNCHVIVAFATADSDTAKRISDMPDRQRKSGDRRVIILAPGPRLTQLSGSTTCHARARRRAHASLRRAIGVRYRHKAVSDQKIRYYEEPLFKARATDIRAGGSGPSQACGPSVPKSKSFMTGWTFRTCRRAWKRFLFPMRP